MMGDACLPIDRAVLPYEERQVYCTRMIILSFLTERVMVDQDVRVPWMIAMASSSKR